MDLLENANGKNDTHKLDSNIDIEKLPLFLTVEELAAVLRIRKNTTYKFVQKGGIQNIRVRNQIRIPKNAVLQFMMETPADA